MTHKTIEEMLAAEDISAVALCLPAQVRFEAARFEIAADKHVFLEKPPGATLSEVEILRELARDPGVTLFPVGIRATPQAWRRRAIGSPARR